MSNPGPLFVIRKTGGEALHDDGVRIGGDLLDFWRWSASDLVSNATRGRLAEYLVARALGVPTDGVRDEWASFDLQMPSGTRIEVKSAAFVQSWHQTKPSAVSFMMPATRAWDPATSALSRDARRQSDLYVFALLCHTEKATIDPLNVHHWRFYVVSTRVLDARTGSQRSITLKSLENLCGQGVVFGQLAVAVEKAEAQMRQLDALAAQGGRADSTSTDNSVTD